MQTNPPRTIVHKGDLSNRIGRYDILSQRLDAEAITYGFNNICLSEARDVNRMRSGGRYINMLPSGLRLPDVAKDTRNAVETIEKNHFANNTIEGEKGCLNSILEESKFYAGLIDILKEKYFKLIKAMAEKRMQVFGMLLGTQIEEYRRSNTLRKAIYSVELRTGPGAHPDYAKYYRYLGLSLEKKLGIEINIGDAEPEVV